MSYEFIWRPSKHIKHPNRKTKTELESETEKLAQLLTDAKVRVRS